MQDSIFIGLDVHKATISIAIAKNERGGEVRHWGTIPHRPDHVRKLVEKLGADQSQLYFCYEAGPCGYESSPIRRVVSSLPFALPFPNEGCDAFIGTIIPKLHQICMHQLGCSAFFVGFALVGRKPCCQLLGIRVQLARAIWRLKRRFDNSLP